MKIRGNNRLKIIALAAICLLLVVITAAAMPHVKDWLKPAEPVTAPGPDDVSPHLIGTDSLELAPEVVKRLGIQTGIIRKAEKPTPLQMAGQLAPNLDRLVRIKLRFTGQIETLGEVTDRSPNDETIKRPLRFGDHVEPGQVLAVIYSRELGEKKSEYTDALSQLRLDEDVLAGVKEAYQTGAIPRASLLARERAVEADRNAANRAERTLRSWDISSADIRTLEAESRNIRKPGENPEQWKKWARLELRAPWGGTVVEKNAAEGEFIDPSTNPPPLFQIEDRSQMAVWAYPYADDLSRLQALPKPIPWTIRLLTNPKAPPIQGRIDTIGAFIDPNSHSAVVMGHVPDREGTLVAGEFITATVELPAPRNEVVMPTSALVEDGHESIIFVQPDPKVPIYTQRRVIVARRGEHVVHLRWLWPDLFIFVSCWPGQSPPAALTLAALFQGSQKDTYNPLRRLVKPEQERVVTNGALELQAALNEQLGNAQAKKDQ